MSESLAEKYRYDDFTEASYRRILETAARRWAFEPFGTRAAGPHVLWRHDVDFSVHRALALARMEADLGLRATYFLLPHSPFYNLLEDVVRDRALAIIELGHDVGLHFDAGFYGGLEAGEELERRLTEERELIAATLGCEVAAFAFHMPEVTGTDGVEDDEIAGMVNAGGRTLRERYSYVSDSNGYWRHRRLPDVVEAGEEERLHVLTHPAWWQREAMSPRERLARCVDGRAAKAKAWYDDITAAWGRESVG